jgi:hypothetical protein
MKKSIAVTLAAVLSLELLIFARAVSAAPDGKNPNIIQTFNGGWCRLRGIAPGEQKHPDGRTLQNPRKDLWSVSTGNAMVDGYFYSHLHYNLVSLDHPEGDPLYCYGSDTEGLVKADFILVPSALTPVGDPPDEPPVVDGYWEGTYHGKYYVDDNGYTWWRLDGVGHGRGIYEGLELRFNGENMKVYTPNCANNIRAGCEGVVEWVPWEFNGYILNPAGE